MATAALGMVDMVTMDIQARNSGDKLLLVWVYSLASIALVNLCANIKKKKGMKPHPMTTIIKPMMMMPLTRYS